MRNKITTAADAVSIIQPGDTICTSGFVGVGVPEELLLALEKRFHETSAPRDLTLVYAAGQGDGKDRGLNILAHEGLLRSEEHTSELQSQSNLVCRLLLEKKKKKNNRKQNLKKKKKKNKMK